MRLIPLFTLFAFSAVAQVPDTSIIKQILEEENIVGASFYYFEKGDDLTYSYGIEKAGTNQKVYQRTVFEAASLSKPLFAHLCYLLEEDSIIDLDEQLHNYLPFEALKQEEAQLITGRMVLQHTTGLPNWIKNADKAKLKFEPGTKFRYSGEGYVYLQRVIEHLTGKKLEELTNEYIFTPYDMQLSSFYFNFALQAAFPHDRNGNFIQKRKTGQHASAASSLHTTIEDYAIFLKKYLPTIPQEDVEVDEKNGLFWKPGVGVELTSNDAFYWHWGNNWDAFRTVFVYSDEMQKGYILFTNSANGHKVLNELNELIFQQKLNFVKWIGGS